jgi:hypothetical protein
MDEGKYGIVALRGPFLGAALRESAAVFPYGRAIRV